MGGGLGGDGSPRSHSSEDSTEVVQITCAAVVGFVVMASAVLLLLSVIISDAVLYFLVGSTRVWYCINYKL